MHFGNADMENWQLYCLVCQICSLLRGGIAERGGVRVGHRIIEINGQSVVAVPHEKIVSMLATAVGEVTLKGMSDDWYSWPVLSANKIGRFYCPSRTRSILDNKIGQLFWYWSLASLDGDLFTVVDEYACWLRPSERLFLVCSLFIVSNVEDRWLVLTN